MKDFDFGLNGISSLDPDMLRRLGRDTGEYIAYVLWRERHENK